MNFPFFKSRKPKVVRRGRAQATNFAEQYQTREAEKERARLDKESQRFEGKRSEARGACFTPAQLRSPETGGQLDGVLLDASPNGVTFRPATSYIPTIDGEQIVIACQELTRVGIVRSTRPDGYGIQLFEPLTEADLDFIYRSTLNLEPRDAA